MKGRTFLSDLTLSSLGLFARLIALTQLINLLSWQPGHSGFGSYVQRVIPRILGIRLQLNIHGEAGLIPFDQWTSQAPPHAWAVMRLLQRNATVQHGQRCVC